MSLFLLLGYTEEQHQQFRRRREVRHAGVVDKEGPQIRQEGTTAYHAWSDFQQALHFLHYFDNKCIN